MALHFDADLIADWKRDIANIDAAQFQPSNECRVVNVDDVGGISVVV